MIISGWQKCSFIDFPGKIATVFFTQGCNFRCPFCHNGELWQQESATAVDEGEVFEFLRKNLGKIGGAVVSGGEPTLQPDLAQFLEKLRRLGLATKLDTNGYDPRRLEPLLEKKLLDFVAMDLKNLPESYAATAGVAIDFRNIEKSLHLLNQSGIDYELRMTVVPGLHDLAKLSELVPVVEGVPRFTLQNFNPRHAANVKLRHREPFREEELEALRPIFEPHVGKFTVR